MNMVGFPHNTKTDRFSQSQHLTRADWRRLPARYVPTGYPLYALLEGSEVVDVAQDSLQDGRLIPIPRDDQRLYRMVASVFARLTD